MDVSEGTQKAFSEKGEFGAGGQPQECLKLQGGADAPRAQ